MDKRFSASNNWSVGALERSVLAQRVPCHPLSRELRRRKLPPPAVLIIDAEGFDARIVTSLDLRQQWGALRLVLFEHKHSQADDMCAAFRQLAAAGFTCECDLANVRCFTPAAACSNLPREPNDPWASCVAGRLHAKLSRCLHKAMPWSRWRVRNSTNSPAAPHSRWIHGTAP